MVLQRSFAVATLVGLLLVCSVSGITGKAKISVMTWVVTGTDPIWEGILKDFRAAHGDQVEVEYLPTDNAQYNAKLATMRAGGVAPDVFMVRLDNYPADALTGQLLDITQFVGQDGQLNRAMIPQDRIRSTINGRWYGLGFKFAFAHAWWNRDLFAAAGVPAMPVNGDKAWEWATFVSNSKKLAQPNADGTTAQYGFALDMHWLRFGSLLKTWGVDFVKSDGFDVGSPAAVEATLAIKELFDQGLGWYRGGARTQFAQRRVGMLFDIDTDPHKPLSNDMEDWSWYGLAAYPKGPGQRASTSYMFGENMAINRTTAYPEASYRFLSFAASRMWNLRGEVPFLYQFRQLHPDERALAHEYAFTHCFPISGFVGFAQQGQQGIGGTWNQIMSGQTPITRLQELQRQLDQAIAAERAGISGVK